MGAAALHAQGEAVKRINTSLVELVKTLGQGHSEHDYPWLVFLLEDTEYAINARHVMRVTVLYEIVPFEYAPDHCPGGIWTRDGMIRLLDLRALFGQGDYLAAIKNKHGGLPLIIVIGIDGKRRGMIVDEIIAMRLFNAPARAPANQDPADQAPAHSRYIQGAVKYDPLKAPALVVSPESFRTVEFENPDVKIIWNGRVDLSLKMENP